MNKKNVDKLIPYAIAILDTNDKIINRQTGKIKGSCGSHMKAFGPAIRQASILKTITFYYKEQNDEDKGREYIAEYVKDVMVAGKMVNEKYKTKDLLTVYIEEAGAKTILEKRLFNQRILEAIVACKLALITYKDEKDKSQVKL
ncbi:MAG: hypothetical protein ABR980_12900 [Ignavibacteriaceae bacterium]|jgi:hypothetical protein